MKPDTVHLIAQKIRHRRAELTVQETWLQKQSKSETQAEGFREINFWRTVLKFAEAQLIATE